QGQGHPGLPEGEPCPRRGREPDQEARRELREPAWRLLRRHRDPGSPHPRVQRDGPGLRRQADPHRLPDRRDRQAGPQPPSQREGHLSMTTTEKTQPRLKVRYREEVRDALNKEFDYANVMQIPGVVKVVVNMGVGDAARDAKLINGAVEDLALITGQKPLVRKATKSIAQFKLREGMPIGAKVTLRGDRMWEFLDRLVSIALPRIRDFRGLSPKQFDGNGNYT